MENNKIKDMTEGTPMKLILRFWGPLFVGMLFQQFYNLIDAMIVGRTIGANALAAVGGTSSINFMIIGFCMGVCNGFAIPVAQAVGEKNEVMMRKYVANSVWLSIVFSLTSTIVVCILCREILIWMNTPAEILEGSYDFIFVIFLGIPIVYLYDLVSAILRSLGDSKTPLYFLIVSSVLNVVLDFIAILGLGMGVEGAACSTVISQAFSGVLCLVFMAKKYPVLKISKEEWRPDIQCMKKLCFMGLPMGLQYSITAIGSVILQTAVNSLGAVAVASITAGNKISTIFCCPFDAMGSTMATYAGQNRGAGKMDRVTDGIKSCSIIALAYAVIACVILTTFGRDISLLFVNGGEVEILQNSATYLRWLSLFYFPLALVNIVRFSIQGLGFGTIAIFAGVFEMFARGIIGFVFVPMVGYIAACFASPLAWVMADIFLIPAYIFVINKLKREILEFKS